MNTISWIKLDTGLMSNQKIRLIRRLPKGEVFFMIWIQLLLTAGIANDGGDLTIAGEFKYDLKQLAKDLGWPQKTMKNAIDLFVKMHMVGVENDVYYILNWSKYQSVKKLDDKKEYDKIKQAESRSNRRKNVNQMSTECQPSSFLEVKKLEVKNKEKDKEKSNKKESGQPMPKDSKEFPSYGIILGAEHLYPVEEESCDEDDSTMSSQYPLN